MKLLFALLITILSLLLTAGCTGRGNAKNDSQSEIDTVSVPDTGYTGIKQYMSRSLIVKEVTFKNGIREGLMKTFYQDGKLRMTFWYENDLREDSSKWYHPDGKLFRSTPYKRDTIDGTQIQYYRNGRVKAKLKYVKGLRTPYLEEFHRDGTKVEGYPELVVNTRDDYETRGIYRISLELSDKSPKVRYYRGDFTNGLFDTTRCEVIENIKGTGTLNLRKTGTPKADYVGVIAEILTEFGNNHLVYKKIDLPYNDLD